MDQHDQRHLLGYAACRPRDVSMHPTSLARLDNYINGYSLSKSLRNLSFQGNKAGSTDSTTTRISEKPLREKEGTYNVLDSFTRQFVSDQKNGHNLTDAIDKYHRNVKYFEQDNNLNTNLHYLLYAERDQTFEECVNDLMTHNFLDMSNQQKQTILHVATIMNKPALCRNIMVHGSPVDLYDNRGNTPLHIACRKGFFECVQVLTRHLNYDEVKDLSYMVPFRCIPQSPELRNYDGLTCLHLAAAAGHYDIVYYLVYDMMADVNVGEGMRGLTPLMQCVESRDTRMVMFLVQQCGASIHVRTYDRKNAVELAMGHGYLGK